MTLLMRHKQRHDHWQKEEEAENYVGKLHYELRINCSKNALLRLYAAARCFVQGNYDAILSLIDGAEGRFVPFGITARRSGDGRTIMCVSVSEPKLQELHGEAGNANKMRQWSESGSCSAKLSGDNSNGGGFLARIEGRIGLATRASGPGDHNSRQSNSAIVFIEVMHQIEAATELAHAAVNADKADGEATVPPEVSLGCSISSGTSRVRVSGPLVSDFYDTEARGRLFRKKFSTLRGEYFIFYSHGESHCRKMLNAMGFKEMQPEQEDNTFRPVERMAVMWCNGTNSAAKRKGGLGYYIVNRLRYRGLITNKCSLSRCLKEFELNHPLLVPVGLEASSFYPDTIHVNGASACGIFDKLRSHKDLYLLKPGHSDCGNGIVLHRSDGSLGKLSADLSKEYAGYAHKDLVMQRYVNPPLLLDGRKFDLRVYLLLVPNQRQSTTVGQLNQRGLYAFCHPGYARLACRPYQPDSNDPLLHLTNQAVQQRDPAYEYIKEDTVWSPDRLNSYLNRHRRELGVPCIDWVRCKLYPRIRAILAHVVSLASSSLCDQPMSHELLGCDFLIGADFNVWLLELNSDPSLSLATSELSRIVTQAVEESVGLAVEVLQLAARGQSAKRLTTMQDFCKIFSHSNESVLRRVMTEAGLRYPEHQPKRRAPS